MATLISYDVDRLVEDMALRGWPAAEVARRAGVSDMTVLRFLRGECQTTKTAVKVAKAMGYPVRRYLTVRKRKAA